MKNNSLTTALLVYKQLINSPMKKIMFTILLAVIVKSGQSQNPNLDFKFGLKLYNYTTSEDRRYRESNITGSTYYNYYTILRPTVAFQWKTKNNNFNEIELTDLKFGKTGTTIEIKNDSMHISQIIDGADFTETSISVRYEYIYTFCKSKECKFVPSLGFSINPYYTLYKTEPKVANAYPTTSQYSGIRVCITPRLTYFFSQKFFADLNIPLMLGDFFYQSNMIDNPTRTKNQRTTSSINISEFKNVFSCRFGIGIKI